MTWHYTPESIEHFYAYSEYYYSYMDIGHKYNDGLIRKKEYQTSVEGQPSGYLYRELVKKGTSGTEILTREYRYVAQTIVDELTESSRNIWFVSSIKDYPYETGNDPVETRFEYTFYENSPQMEQKITVLPLVTPGRNGNAVSASRIERFDRQGHQIWSKDELGIINCNVYDHRRDVRTRSILDVDITRTSDFSMTVPSGWTTVSGAGKHLITDYEYDLLGRLVQSLGPQNIAINDSNETITIRPANWIVYDDINNRVLSASGFAILDNSNEITGYTLVNPVSITIRNAAGSVLEKIQATRANTSGPLLATDTFAQSTYVAWEKHLYDTSGRLTAIRKYHLIPESGEGVNETNYTETQYSYDVRNRQNRLLSADGTIMRNVHDWRGNVIQTWIGTDDTGATDSTPHPSSATTNNMVIVSETEYGAGSGSCPTCSGATDQPRVAIQHVDAETSRVTEFGYDWRGRQTHVHYDEDENGNLTYAVKKYDNMDRMVKSELWLVASSINEGDPDEEGLFSSDSDGSSGSDDEEPPTPEPVEPEDTDTSNQGNRLLSRTRQYYDQRGNVCKTEQSVVDPATGTVQGLMLGQNWYDAKGRVIKSQSVGENTFTKTVYDSLGRVVKNFTVLDTDESAYLEAGSLEGDTVFQQTETVYDNLGNVLTKISVQRKEDAVGTGELTASTGQYQISANWYDGTSRPIASANYGDNGGEVFTRPETVPTRSDTVLLTETFYDNTGRSWKTVDPAGKDHRVYFDDLGRTLKTIANYVLGTANAEHPDQDVTVEYTYNTSGQLATLTAVNPTTGNQITRYAYGTAKTALSPKIYRNDLLVAEIYPDSDDFENIGKNLQKGEDAVDDRIEYQYNRQGEKIRKRDQNGSFHRYNYDNFGRMTQDRITVFGTGVDSAVRRIATTYTVTGQVKTITSYANPTVGFGDVINQVRYEYNELGLLSKEYQNPTGKVDANSLYVGYTYDTTKNGEVFTKRLRPTAVYYPSGTIVLYDYGQSGSYDDLLNRIASIQNGDTTVVTYRYQGLATPVITTYNEPNVALDYTAQDALDRFGRITDHAWKNASSQDIVRIKHGYDRIGNRLYREDLVAVTNGQYFDELYSYDEMNQVTSMTRGQLNSAKTAINSGTSYAETFTFDSTGNWTAYNQDTNGDGTFELNQTRTHNAANELTAIGNSSANIATDANGNMTKVPKPETWGAGYSLVYDGWNRLVEVIDSLTVNLVAQYEYNGLNHRILKKTYTNGNLTETRKFFFNGQWQCLEEYLTGTDTPNIQYTWGQRYIDDLICRDRDTAQNGTLNERLYSLADPNWNVVALISRQDVPQERYTYSAFGKPSLFTGDFATVRNSSAYNWTRTFTGQVLDTDTGIMLYRNRYYHTTLGRFISRDPIGYEGDPKNLYRHVYNVSVLWIDPFGYTAVSIGPAPQLGPDSSLTGCSINSCYNKCEQLPSITYGLGDWLLRGGVANPRQNCMDNCSSAMKNYDDWYIENSDTTWTLMLPECPCKLKDRCQDEWSDPGHPEGGYHVGATDCIRSNRTRAGHASQCCYNSDGDLITSGSGQGSADWALGAATSFINHYFSDMRPANMATFLDGGTWGCFSRSYLNVRPNMKKDCKEVPTPLPGSNP